LESPSRVQKVLTISPAVARGLPFAIYILFLVLESTLPRGSVGFDLRWLYLVKIAFVAAALAMLWDRYTELRAPPPTSAISWLTSAAVGVLIFAIWIMLDEPWVVIKARAGWNPTEPSGAVNWNLVAVRIIGAAAVVPVMEELFWRSLVLRWIRNADFMKVVPRSSGTFAVIASSTLFALEHHEWLAGLVAGLAYAGTYMRTGNLWCAVLAHAFTNLLLGVWVLYTGQWQFW